MWVLILAVLACWLGLLKRVGPDLLSSHGDCIMISEHIHHHVPSCSILGSMRRVIHSKDKVPAVERVYAVKHTSRGEKVVAKDKKITQRVSGSSSPSKDLWLADNFLQDQRWEADNDFQSPSAKKRRTGKVGKGILKECFWFLIFFQTQHDFLREWKEESCSLHLEELIRLEAPPSDKSCVYCNTSTAEYRCIDCHIGQRLICLDCCIKMHQHLPFHQISKWTGSYFKKADLGDLGLKIYLGHDGKPCPHGEGEGLSGADVTGFWEDAADDEMDSDNDLLLNREESGQQNKSRITFIANSGIYQRSVAWCHCLHAPLAHIQLFQMRLFSASIKNPSTAFTFDVLDHFHIDAMECKTAAYNFYSKLQRMSNNAFPFTLPVIHNFFFLSHS